MQALGRFNYYEVLELKSNAPQHEITAAYDRAKNTYTGENPALYTIFSEKEARELMVLIDEAYSILGNKTLRQIYDQRLLSGRSLPDELSYDSIMVASKSQLPENRQADKKPIYTRNELMEQKIKANTDWDGNFLKEIREYKGLTHNRLYDITKINPCYIQAIEEMNANNLPATVFVRGYVVQLAKALGLEEKKVADSYMSQFKAKAV